MVVLEGTHEFGSVFGRLEEGAALGKDGGFGLDSLRVLKFGATISVYLAGAVASTEKKGRALQWDGRRWAR